LVFGGFNVCRDPIKVKKQALPSRIDLEPHALVHQLSLLSAVAGAVSGDGYNLAFTNTYG